MPISFFAVLRCLGAEGVVEKTKSTCGRCAALRIVDPTKFLFIFMSFSSSSLSLLLLSIATAAPSFGARALDSAPPVVSDSVRSAATDSTRRAVKLNSALVVGRRQNKVNNAMMGLNYLRPEQIRSIPTIMGEVDLVKALQMQPGVSPGLEGLAGMMVRGGNDDQNLFLIDGNPIYQMNHLGGLFSAFNVAAIRDVAFYKSSFPARYGGRLSSVVDVATQPGDAERYHVNFGIGLTSANLGVSGPIVKGRTSFNIALRRTWFDVLTTPLLAIANVDAKRNGEKFNAHYAFTDFNLHLNHRTNRWGTFSFVGYAGQDDISTGTDSWNQSAKTPKDEVRDKYEMGMRWGNRLASFKWQLPLGEHWMHNLTLAYTRYGSKCYFVFDNEVGRPGVEGYSHNYLYKEIRNGIDDWNARSQWVWAPQLPLTLRLGLDYTYHRFSPEDRITNSSLSTLLDEPNRQQVVKGHETALYGDAEWRPAEAWRVNAGLRLTDFLVNSKNYLSVEPRLSAAYLFSPSVSVKAGYSRMTQYVQQVSVSYLSLPTDYWMPVTEIYAPPASDQLSIGGYYTYHNRWNVSVEGWYKHMSNLLDYREGVGQLSSARSWNDKLTTGTGESYGVDVLVEKNFGHWAGFLGYGLMWTDRYFPKLNRGAHFPSKYDNRHKLNVALSYRPSRRWEFNAAWTYMTGSLITLALENYHYEVPNKLAPRFPDYYNQTMEHVRKKNNYRLPDFHRLDLGINYYRFHKRSGAQSIWTLSVYNAYNQHNPVVVARKNDYDYPTFRLISLFPIIPSFTYTYRF